MMRTLIACAFAFVSAICAAALIPAGALANVTAATLTATVPNYLGPCPTTVAFQGTIVGTPLTSVTWGFIRNGTPGPLHVQTMPNTGQFSVSDTIGVTVSSSGYDQITVANASAAGALNSARAAYAVTCSGGPPPTPSTSAAIPYQAPLRPCPTCTLRTYTLRPIATGTWGHEDGGGANIFCSLPHYPRPGLLIRPAGSTIVGFADTYDARSCNLGAVLADFWKIATLLRFDFSGHIIHHIYSARLQADVAGNYLRPSGQPLSQCVSSVRILASSWPTSSNNGLLAGPAPSGNLASNQSSATFLSATGLDADVSTGFVHAPYLPPSTPLLPPSRLFVDDPHGASNSHTSDDCLVYFSNWRLVVSADN